MTDQDSAGPLSVLEAPDDPRPLWGVRAFPAPLQACVLLQFCHPHRAPESHLLEEGASSWLETPRSWKLSPQLSPLSLPRGTIHFCTHDHGRCPSLKIKLQQSFHCANNSFPANTFSVFRVVYIIVLFFFFFIVLNKCNFKSLPFVHRRACTLPSHRSPKSHS